MIKVTDTEQIRMLGEQYGEGEYFYPETFFEFEQVEQIKNEVYHAMWDAVQSTYDMYETAWHDRHLFNEAGWRDRADISTDAMPNIPREFIRFGHDDIRYLRQADPSSHASMLTNRYSANPKDAPYVGWGLFGALQARANGQEIGNYAPEIRMSVRGRRVQSIRNRKDGSTIPLIMAITKRPIDPTKPEIMPPMEYGSHKKWKVDPKTGKKVYSKEPGQGEWGPQNGVYTGYADAIEKLEAKIGHPLKNRPMQKGEVGSDLRPPVPKDIDPTASSYLGVTDPVTGQKLPPSAAGYKPQGIDTSSTFYDSLNKWLRGIQNNPELFDKRYLAGMLRQQQAGKRDATGRVTFGTDGKYGHIPMEPSPTPWTKNVPAATPPNVDDPEALKRTDRAGRNYYGRAFVPDPSNPNLPLVMSRSDKRPWSDKEREKLAQHYDSIASELENSDEPYEGLLWWKEMSDSKDYDFHNQLAAWKKNPSNTMSDDAKEIYSGLTAVMKKIQGFKSAAQRLRQPNAGPVPSKVNLGRGGYVHDEDEEGNVSKITDEEGDTVRNPITGPVLKTKLPHNYELLPVPGDPMQLSPEFIQQIRDNVANFGKEYDKWKLTPSGKHLPDQIFAQDLVTYGLELQQNGTFKATQQTNQTSKIPQYKNLVYSWASERDGQVEFYYLPKDKEVDMPIYSPGVVDARKRGLKNRTPPSILGGIQSAPDGSPELAPMRDADQRDFAMHGKMPPNEVAKLANMTKEKVWKGWQNLMMDAVKGGVATGITEVKKKTNSDDNDRLGQWLTSEYTDMINDAMAYCIYNLGNSKAIEFKTDNINRLNMNYIKRMFRPLYAATKSFDNWYLNPIQYNNISKFFKSKGQQPPPRKSIQQMSIKEFWKTLTDAAEYLYDAEGDTEGAMFQVKMKPSHVKGDILKGAVSDTNFKRSTAHLKQLSNLLRNNGVPEDQILSKAQKLMATGNYPMTPNPDPVPYNPMVNDKGVDKNDPRGYRYQKNNHEFNVINVSPSVLMELFNEARRNYWWFAAKDMVLKLWKSEYSKLNKEKSNSEGEETSDGGRTTSSFDNAVFKASRNIENGADAAQELVKMRELAGFRGGQKDKYTNDIPNANILRAQIVSDITGKKREFEKYRAMAMKDGSLNNIMGMTRAKYEAMRAEKNAEVYDILKKKATQAGIPPKDQEAYILANFEKEMEESLTISANRNAAAIEAAMASKNSPNASASNRDQVLNATDEYSPQSVLNQIKERRGSDLNDKGLAMRAQGILEMDPAQLQKFNSEMKGIQEDDDDDYEEFYKDIITYHGLEYLMRNADKMDDVRKSKALSFLKMVRNFGFHDLSEFGTELLDGDGEREAA